MADFGRFVWHDLLTSDVQVASSFYASIAGWKYEPGRDGALMIRSETEEIGRIAPMPPSAAGAPPHWLGYVAVQDVDEMARRATELGGRIVVPGTDVPGVGRFAVLADPQGAVFAIFGSDQGPHEADRNRLGRFSWAELNTTDWESAWKFYSSLFGWKPTSSMDMGPEHGTYFMFGTDEKNSMGGMPNAATTMKAPAHWLYYFNVADVQEGVKAVEAAGGKVLNGPMEIPGDDWIAICADPQGAHFAIYSHSRK